MSSRSSDCLQCRPGRLWPLLMASMAAAFSGGACSDTLQPAPRPPAPRMVVWQDDPFLERGIRPDPFAPTAEDSRSGAIIVEWQAPDASGVDGVRLGGYKVYRSGSVDAAGVPSGFARIATLNATAAGVDTFLSDTGARQNRGYAYYVTAFGAEDPGLEGPASDTVAFTLCERPVPASPAGTLRRDADDSIRFRFSPASASGYVAVELQEVSAENEQLVLRTLWRIRAMAGFYEPSIVYTGEPLESGHRYRWRVEKIFPQSQPIGNASRWVTFIVQ